MAGPPSRGLYGLDRCKRVHEQIHSQREGLWNPVRSDRHRQRDVIKALACKGPSLRQGRDGDAAEVSPHLKLCDFDTFVGLHVRTKADTKATGALAHHPAIGVDLVAVDEQRRGAELGNLHGDSWARTTFSTNVYL